MGFKKLFDKFRLVAAPEAAASTSTSTSASTADPRLWKRGYARVRVTPLHSVRYELADAKQVWELGNLSLSGAGLLCGALAAPGAPDGPASELTIEKRLEGFLRLRDQLLPAPAKVVRVDPLLVGIEFEAPSALLKAGVLRFFELEFLAVEMVRADPKLLQTVPDGVPYWFHGRNGCELFFVMTPDASELLRFELSFFGNQVEGGKGISPRFGELIADEESEVDRPTYKSSPVIRWNSSYARETAELAVRLVNGIEKLDPRHRARLLAGLGAGDSNG